jgi:hypothetical protein
MISSGNYDEREAYEMIRQCELRIAKIKEEAKANNPVLLPGMMSKAKSQSKPALLHFRKSDKSNMSRGTSSPKGSRKASTSQRASVTPKGRQVSVNYRQSKNTFVMGAHDPTSLASFNLTSPSCLMVKTTLSPRGKPSSQGKFLSKSNSRKNSTHKKKRDISVSCSGAQN